MYNTILWHLELLSNTISLSWPLHFPLKTTSTPNAKKISSVIKGNHILHFHNNWLYSLLLRMFLLQGTPFSFSLFYVGCHLKNVTFLFLENIYFIKFEYKIKIKLGSKIYRLSLHSMFRIKINELKKNMIFSFHLIVFKYFHFYIKNLNLFF